MARHLAKIGLGLALALGVTACADDDFYGHPGYAYYNPGWGQPYWGWYNGFYYPGTGVLVYDRYRVGRPWDFYEQQYWIGRQRGWRGPGFQPNWGGWRGGWRGGGWGRRW